MSTRLVDSESSPPEQPLTEATPEAGSVRRKITLLNAARWFGIILLFCFVAFVLLLFLPNKRHHLSITHDFGIGFDLSPSYGTVAVSYPNGSIEPIARVQGDEAYRKMMLRLSLPSSQHLHQPYQDVAESIGDMSRRFVRDSLKKLGFPASRDVGTLSKMIRALQEEASNFVGEPVSAATISVPRLAALYGEDLIDAFEYLSLFHLEIFRFYNYRPIHATLAAYVGHGLGLCRDYRDAVACDKEELQIQSRYALSVSYTHTSLSSSIARVAHAYYLEEAWSFQDLRLGYDERHEESYWEAVREMIRSPVVKGSIRRNVTMVLVFGDATDKPRFRKILEEVVPDIVDSEPEILDQQPEFSAAKGAAELAKRVIFRQRKGLETVSDL
ncbi:hypothetical protein GQ53DRAFT_836243 [Thozetella sp. PMI_491]|nr:hypothetical protein GQ53DRAFT_836243 [Thozetella sp. PMI_491]